MGDSYLNSKQTESKQRYASDEQENRPENDTIIKPDPNNSISTSNKLKKKKSSSNSRRLKRKPRSAFRSPPNAKPMPSLADLEKMFEDSDDDVISHESTEVKQHPAPQCSAQTSSSSSPIVVIDTTSPSRKRKKSHEQSDDLPLNIRSEKKSVTAENISHQSTSVSEAFSPIPSTSRSTEIFIKNENLYLASLTVNQKISETHNTTIVIEDEPMDNSFSDVKIDVHDTNKITDTKKYINPTTPIISQNSCEDDDCIIVEPRNNYTTNQTNIIDVVDINTTSEYDSDYTEQVCDEIIDVDAVIAQNQSLIDEYKTNFDPTKLVVDVDISTGTQSTNIPSGHTTNDHQTKVQASHEKISILFNMQSQPATSRTLPISSSFGQNGPPCTAIEYISTTAVVKSHKSRRGKEQNNRDTQLNKKGSSTDVDAGKHHSKSTTSLRECPICIENMTGKELGSTICGHVFCMRCLEISMRHTKKCPFCRKVLKKNGYHKIFI